MLVQKGAISLKPVALTAHRRLWETSCSFLGCTHSSGYQTWQRATGAGGSTWEPHLCLCCITTAAKPSSGSKHTAKVNFSPLLFAVKPCKTLQSWGFVFLLPNQDHIVPDAFKQRTRACLNQRTCSKVSWITL